jgi:hypothetical protein
MAIQFHCPGCSQPIEVDDVYAGQAAACPYCRRVVNVPTESTLGREQPAAARPALGETPDSAAAPPPPPGALHAGASETYRDRLARTYGNYALICTVLAILLSVGTMVYGAMLLADMVDPSAASQPSMQQLSEDLARQNPALAAGPLGAMLFAVIGLALGITSVKQTARKNWRGIVSIVVCGLFVLCFCGINTLTLFGGGFPASAAIL